MLESLTWDGKERIRYALSYFLGADSNNHVGEVMTLHMLAVVEKTCKRFFSLWGKTIIRSPRRLRAKYSLCTNQRIYDKGYFALPGAFYAVNAR